jgi:hypothetical protein
VARLTAVSAHHRARSAMSPVPSLEEFMYYVPV